MQLKNKTILITGGTSGLGFTTAKMLLEKEANVIIISANESSLEKAAKEIGSAKLTTIKCDVADSNDVENMSRQVKDIDILINNAGVWVEGDLENNSYSEISRMIDVNVKGVIYVTKAILPLMKTHNKGYILNVSSTSGVKAKSGQSAYVASKFAVQGFTEGLKEDLIGTGISIIGFYPGGMDTELFKKSGSKRDTSSFMNTQDIAETICFILEHADKMTLEHVVITRPKKSI